MADIFDKCKGDGGYFGAFRHMGENELTRPVMGPLSGKRMMHNGEEHIMWSVNNYIGLANNEEVREAAMEAVKEFSISNPMGSRMMSGNTTHHLALEKRLAEFSQKEAAFLFNFGYMAVLGIVSSLAGMGDTVVVDKLAHASILDAAGMAKAAGANLRYFKHNDANDLDKVLASINKTHPDGGVLILTEGVYGMTGDLADLKGICEVKEKWGARLFIDDAHGLGVMGEKGRGAADFFGVQDKVDIYFGTFAKGFASIGGFCACNKDVRDWIMFNARTQVFAKSLPMVYVKSLDKTLDLVLERDDLRDKMWENSKKLQDGLRNEGYAIGPGDSPICSVFCPVGTEKADDAGGVGVKMVSFLRAKKIFVTAVVYPVIPPGLCMFRMIPTAAHTDAEINETIEAFRAMKSELNLTLPCTPEDQAKIDKLYRCNPDA
jgi:glycine C-acetyltransferase